MCFECIPLQQQSFSLLIDLSVIFSIEPKVFNKQAETRRLFIYCRQPQRQCQETQSRCVLTLWATVLQDMKMGNLQLKKQTNVVNM